MTDPQGMMDAIRAALADDGTWLLVDIKARDTFAENVGQEPDGPADVRHQRAVVHVVGDVDARRCRARHARPAGEPRRRRWPPTAGFGRFRTLDVDHAINAFYEVRPLTDRT